MIHGNSISASSSVDTGEQHLCHGTEDALERGLGYLSTLDGVDSCNIGRCRTIQDNLIEWMRSAGQLVGQPEVQDWGWVELIENEYLRVGLLTLDETNTIPIHDHPGSTGLLVILEGHLQVQQFQYRESSISPSPRRMVEMEQVNRQQLGPGEFTAFSPTQGNIHSLCAYNGPCLILDVLLAPYRNEDRTWYMPLEDNDLSEPHFSAVRLNRALRMKGH